MNINQAYFCVLQDPKRYGLGKSSDSADCHDRAEDILNGLHPKLIVKLEKDIQRLFPSL
jgi:hypothetical protein